MQGRQVLTTTYSRSVGGQRHRSCGQMLGASIASVARALILRVASVSLLLTCSIANVAALDLRMPKDVLGEGRITPISERGKLMGEAFGSAGSSPAVSLYTGNVKETIKRRFQGFYPRDGVGRVICGEASYAMALRSNGSIERLEVVPVKRNDASTSSVESYYSQPMLAGLNEGSAKYSETIATGEEELNVFAQSIADQLRSIAPYPAHSTSEAVPSGVNGNQRQAPLMLITGNIGVKCTQWRQ